MKRDHSFTLVATIIFVGVIVALVSPTLGVRSQASAEAVHPTAHTE